jgi:hypothetical protein
MTSDAFAVLSFASARSDSSMRLSIDEALVIQQGQVFRAAETGIRGGTQSTYWLDAAPTRTASPLFARLTATSLAMAAIMPWLCSRPTRANSAVRTPNGRRRGTGKRTRRNGPR